MEINISMDIADLIAKHFPSRDQAPPEQVTVLRRDAVTAVREYRGRLLQEKTKRTERRADLELQAATDGIRRQELNALMDAVPLAGNVLDVLREKITLPEGIPTIRDIETGPLGPAIFRAFGFENEDDLHDPGNADRAAPVMAYAARLIQALEQQQSRPPYSTYRAESAALVRKGEAQFEENLQAGYALDAIARQAETIDAFLAREMESVPGIDFDALFADATVSLKKNFWDALNSAEIDPRYGLSRHDLRAIKTKSDFVPTHLSYLATLMGTSENMLTAATAPEWDNAAQARMLPRAVDVIKDMKRLGIGRLLIDRGHKTPIEANLAKRYVTILNTLAERFPGHAAQVAVYNPAAFERSLFAHFNKHPFAYHRMRSELLDICARHVLATGVDDSRFLRLLDESAQQRIADRAGELAAQGERGEISRLVEKLTDRFETLATLSAAADHFGADFRLWDATDEQRDMALLIMEQRLAARDPALLQNWGQCEKACDALVKGAIIDFSQAENSNILMHRLSLYQEVGAFNDPTLTAQHRANTNILAGHMLDKHAVLIDKILETTDKTEQRELKLQLFHHTVEAYRHLYGIESHQTEYVLDHDPKSDRIAAFGRQIGLDGQIISRFLLNNLEDMSPVEIIAAAGHEETHELQAERERLGDAYCRPDILEVRGQPAAQTEYQVRSRADLPPSAIKVTKAGKDVSEDGEEIISNGDLARAVGVSKALERILYAQSAHEREAHGAQYFLEYNLYRLWARRFPEDSPSRIELANVANQRRAMAHTCFEPDRNPARYAGPKTQLLRDLAPFL